MKKDRSQASRQKAFFKIKYMTPIVLICVLLASALCALWINTTGLHETLRKTTAVYADEVSAQLASNISYRMRTRGVHVCNLADTFSRMPAEMLTEELLDRKAKYLELQNLFVIYADGTPLPGHYVDDDLQAYIRDHPDLHDYPQIFITTGECVFFSAPIHRQNGTSDLLIGTRSNAMLQEMLQQVNFQKQGLCCIVDQDGTVVVSAPDETPFSRLRDIFAENAEGEADQVMADISAHHSGLAQLHSVTGEPILLGYDFLGINDWMLLTLVTADLFSADTGPYLMRYIVITGLLCLVMAGIFLSVVWYDHRMLEDIQSVAMTDPLTGGHNALAFRVRCETMLRTHPERAYAIVYLNILDFKHFNERFGVHYGDGILQQVYRQLERSLHDGELLGRSSGDHFYLLLESDGEQAVQQRLERMLSDLVHQLSTRFSFDQLCFDQGGYMIRDRSADLMLMMDRAKIASTYPLEGAPCRFYDDALGRQMERERELDAGFQHALENHEFKLYIQPKVRPGQAGASGGEVLVRWQHPTFGLLFPGEFIPLFERSGKICALDFYMFEETCRLLRTWQAQGRQISLSVNLSRAHLTANDLSFLDRFREIKQRYEIPDGVIELELTESLMLERRDLSLVITMIDRIRSMGFLCSIDDFGFGYSSLSLLKDLNVTTVKLDRQFFLDESEKSWLVVGQLIQLAHSLDMTVVAEGIEERTQVEQLHTQGCDLVQGYVYAKPMPAVQFEAWLDQNPTQGKE